MSHSLAALDRFLTFLAGLLFLAVGTFSTALFFDEPHAQEYSKYLYLEHWDKVMTWEYIRPALGAITAIAAFIGLWLISMNLRRRRINTLGTSATSGLGSIQVNIDSIADAMAASLEQHPKVTRAAAKVVQDRKLQTLELNVTAEPTVDMVSLKTAIAQQEAAFRAAVRDLDVAASYRIHLGPVQRP